MERRGGKKIYIKAASQLAGQAWEAGFKAGSNPQVGECYGAFLAWYQDKVVEGFFENSESEAVAKKIADHILQDGAHITQIVLSYLKLVEGKSELYLSARQRMEIERFGSDYEDGQYDRVKEATQGVLKGLDFPPKLPTLDKLLQDYGSEE